MAEQIDSLVDGHDDVNTAEVRTYELGFHLDSELPQEEVKKTFQEIHGRITALGTVVAEGEPTKIPLAYTISRSDTTGRRDFNSAFFAWIAYDADGPAHEEISTMARNEKRIIRFIDIRTSHEAAKHSADMHELFLKNALDDARDDEPEEVLPAEEPVEKEVA